MHIRYIRVNVCRIASDHVRPRQTTDVRPRQTTSDHVRPRQTHRVRRRISRVRPRQPRHVASTASRRVTSRQPRLRRVSPRPPRPPRPPRHTTSRHQTTSPRLRRADLANYKCPIPLLMNKAQKSESVCCSNDPQDANSLGEDHHSGANGDLPLADQTQHVSAQSRQTWRTTNA